MERVKCVMVIFFLLFIACKSEAVSFNQLAEEEMENLWGGTTVSCALCNQVFYCGTEAPCAHKDGEFPCRYPNDCTPPLTYTLQSRYRDCGVSPGNSCTFDVYGCGPYGFCTCNMSTRFCYNNQYGYITQTTACQGAPNP